MNIIETTGLGHAYGDVVALHGLELELEGGTIGLVGANGAGKTTLVKILLGILTPTLGSVKVFGIPVAERPLEVRARVGYMPERDCLPEDQTASDFVTYTAELAGLPKKASRQRASDVLTLVGLHEERFRPIGEFSTGMKQRTKLAQAIVHDPDLVLLDEPTSGLDPQGREDMLSLVGRLGGFGINVVTSSHVLTDIEQTCDWVVMLDGGKVLRSGPLSGLGETGVIEVELTTPIDPFVAWMEANGATTHYDGRAIFVRTERNGFEMVRDGLAATDSGLRRLKESSTSLEDIFMGRST